MEIITKKISDLKPRPDNPRQSNKTQEDNLKKSLEKFGVVEPIVFNKQSGYIVGGHFRVRELKKMGVKEVPCVVVDLNKADEKELNIRLNANTGAWDYDILANQWDADLLTEWGVELQGLELVESEFSDMSTNTFTNNISSNKTAMYIGKMYGIISKEIYKKIIAKYDFVEKDENGNGIIFENMLKKLL